MPKKWFSIKAQADADVAEVSILDYIGMWGVNAPEFLKEFRAIKAQTVKVFINSPGGSVFDALAMFNGMRATGKTIEVHILGVAASAASYIAMAGDKIIMPSNTMMFVHNPINAVFGNAEELRAAAATLDKIGESLMATYRKRFKGEESVLEQLFAEESYLTAQECLDYGLCDEVTDEIKAVAAFDVEALPEAVRALFETAKPEPEPEPEPVAPEAVRPERVQAIAAEAGIGDFASVLMLDATLATEEQYRAAAREAADVVALFKALGKPEGAAASIRARQRYADIRAALAAEMVAADEATVVDTAPKSTPAGPKPFNPMALWAEIHELEKQSRSKQ